MTSEIPQTFTAGFGGFVSADAELSISIEEFRRVRVPRAPASLVRVRSFNSNRMPFIHIWSAAFGLQIHDRGPTPFAPVMLIPITTGRFYPMLVQRHPVRDVPSGHGPGRRELQLPFRLYHGVLCLHLSRRGAPGPCSPKWMISARGY
jgi:hypothetical protein